MAWRKSLLVNSFFSERGVLKKNIPGALGALAVGFLHDGTAWPLVVVMGSATVLAAAIFWLAAPWRGTGQSHDDVVGDSSDDQFDHQTEQH